MEPWGTPALTSDQSETCPFNKTLCFLFLRKSHKRFSKLSDIPFRWHSRVVILFRDTNGRIQLFLKRSFFSWMRDLIVLLNHRGSLPSQATVAWGIKLLIIFNIVLLKIDTFSLTLVLRKAQSQWKSVIARLISSVFTCL